MPRSNWEGYISFGLVTIPISLYTSQDTSTKVSFHQLDKRNHARVKYQRVNSETGKEVPWENIVKGYEYNKDEIFVVAKGELEKMMGENVRTIAIESFVSANAIHFIDIEKTYYIVPRKNGEKGYVILREALAKTHKIGIAKVIISTKEYLAALAVYENALVLYLLHYSNEVRKLTEFDLPAKETTKYKVTAKEIAVASKLIQSMTKQWKPEKYKDEYSEMVHKWAEEKAKKMPHSKMAQRAKPIHKVKTVNFMDLLKESLKSTKGTSRKTPIKMRKTTIPARAKSARHASRHH